MTVSRDIVIRAGQAFALSLPYAGTAGRGQRMHIRWDSGTATVVQILTHNGAANARVLYNGTDALVITIGASVSALWLVGAERVEWRYDLEDYSLSDVDDVIVTHAGKCIVYENTTREADVTPSAQMPSGDGRYVRFDTDAQGLSDAQKLAARTNIGAGTGGGGGSGDVVGPASVTDDRIAAFDTTSGKLIKQGSVTATAVASHLSNTSNPHSVTAAQAGADPAGTAASAVSAHAALTEAHGISTYGASLVNDADAATARGTLGLGTAATAATGDFEPAGSIATHAALTSSVHGITAAGAALIDDADAAAQRTTLGLGTAATQASSAFEPAGAISTHNAVTTAHGISAFGATLADDADAATARTTLGLGTAATTAATDYATAAQGTDDRTASGLRTASTVVSVSAATAPTSGQVLTATSTTAATWQTPSGGGSGDVVGPASATDNAIARFDTTTGKLVQDSGVTVSDVSGSSVTVASTAGNALAIAATAPAATTGASQAGKAASLTATAAVASTDTAGAAAGGNVTITAGAAARLTSGNANGGNISLVPGAGIGTGTSGQVYIGVSGTAAAPSLSWSSWPGTGLYQQNTNYISFAINGAAFAHMSINEGGFTLIGNTLLNYTRYMLAATTSITEPTYMRGGVTHNSGATSLVTRTLPGASAGAQYTYVVMDADGLKIQAASGDDIRVIDKLTSAAGYIQSTTVGSVVCLLAVDSTTWVALHIHGVWTDGTFSYDDTSLTTP